MAAYLGRFVVALDASETGETRDAHYGRRAVTVIRIQRLRRHRIQIEVQVMLRGATHKNIVNLSA